MKDDELRQIAEDLHGDAKLAVGYILQQLNRIRTSERERTVKIVERHLDPQSDRCETIVDAIRGEEKGPNDGG